ncbi:Periplasmic component of the Tol biopolymer transport system-like protein [Salinispora tropica CNB-440]|uniref:Periplasmic component of the Tol biopolymer transport system-like protein n=2 Tax=Salinispora tropica TaxID=168695 RepID=A4X2J2_SALTO|nr:Periplasmic component of the Tol biopolymer transport system-like protein [Salinispora tropica CNB-440]
MNGSAGMLSQPGRVRGPTFQLHRLAEDPAGAGDGAISPDGTRFVASSRRTGSLNLWFYEIATEQWHQGTRGAGDDIEAQWSPDSACLAFTSSRCGHKAVWLYRLHEARISRLTFGPYDEEYPNWSPDGSKITFVGGGWAQRQVYLVSATGGPPMPVTDEPGRTGACTYLPDGSGLICHSYDTGASAVSILPLDGSMPRQVTDGSTWDYKPTVSSAHPVVAFSRSLEGRSVIWVQQLAEPYRGRALVVEAGDDRWPNWTADGQHLFFHRLVDRGVGIWVLDRRTDTVTQVVGPDEQPRYGNISPDGTRLIYAAEESGRSVVKVREISGGLTKVLPLGDAAFPQWSPNGRTVAYLTRDVSRPRWEIATYDLATATSTVWTCGVTWPKSLHGPLDWSPDSTRLVFSTDTEPFEADLCVLDLRDGSVTKLTEDPWWDEAPSWTPDGTGVVFLSTRGGDWTWGFYRMDLSTGEIHALARPDYIEKNNPRMLPDGTLIYSLAVSGIEDLFEQLPDGRGRVLSSVGPAVRYPVPSRDGSMLAFTRTHRTVEYWLAKNVWGAGSPIADLADGDARRRGTHGPQTRTGPVRSPVNTRRR